MKKDSKERTELKDEISANQLKACYNFLLSDQCSTLLELIKNKMTVKDVSDKLYPQWVEVKKELDAIEKDYEEDTKSKGDKKNNERIEALKKKLEEEIKNKNANNPNDKDKLEIQEIENKLRAADNVKKTKES
jgi:hypothetical protein